MKSAARELGPQGIRVTTVNPGPVDNRMMRSIEKQSAPDAPDTVKDAGGQRHGRAMATITIFGTVTSPYVRRVRVVAHELGMDAQLIDTFSKDGEAALRELSPIWKVPTARIDQDVIYDSAVINQHLLRRFGPGPLAAFDADDIAARNAMSVIDGALDALINVFYLAKDGVSDAPGSYLAKQRARAASAMAWLDREWSATSAFGLVEIALLTSLDWMRFREMYDVGQHERLTAFAADRAARASLVATAPPTL